MSRVTYKWSAEKSESSLDAYLARHPPSKTKNAKGGDGWIWVHSGRAEDAEDPYDSKNVEEATKALDLLLKRFDDIEQNPKIPKIKSKTSGPSKRMLKDGARDQIEQQLREIGKKETSGKWMFFEGASYVDKTFSKLAKSLVDGPLSRLTKAKCHTIKVATADSLESASGSGNRKEPTSLICLYFDDVWNAEHAKEVLVCVVKEHGVIPNSVKPDLYTLAGLDSKHPSGIRCTLYRPGEMVNWDTLKEWQSAAFAEMRKVAEGKVSKGDGEEAKRRKGKNDSVIPIRPEDFWAATSDDEFGNDKDFEDVQTPEPDKKVASLSPETDRVGQHSSLGTTVPSDSETEEEEEIVAFEKAAGKQSKEGTASPAADGEQRASADSQATDEAAADPAHEQRVEETEAATPLPVKHTVLPVASMIKPKKRDRFGRSDF